MKKLLLIPLIVFSLNLSAAEYGYIKTGQQLTIDSGDLLECLTAVPHDSGKRVLAVDSLDDTIFNAKFTQINDFTKNQIIFGPATISISSITGSDGAVAYKLTRASEVKTVTNSITIPAIADQEWAVTLERSTDLANWETVAPGTVIGTDGLQFFRLRVGGETTTVESTSTGGN